MIAKKFAKKIFIFDFVEFYIQNYFQSNQKDLKTQNFKINKNCKNLNWVEFAKRKLFILKNNKTVFKGHRVYIIKCSYMPRIQWIFWVFIHNWWR